MGLWRVFFRHIVDKFSELGLQYKRAVLLQFPLKCVTTESRVNPLEMHKVGAAVVMVFSFSNISIECQACPPLHFVFS